jgi:hypothetical protein
MTDVAKDEMTAEERATQQRCIAAADQVLMVLSSSLVDGSGHFSKREALASMAMAMGKLMAIVTKPGAGERELASELWAPLEGIAFESMRNHREQLVAAKAARGERRH